MGNYTILYMFENPRRGRQARNFTTNSPKILDLKSSFEQIFSRKLPLGAPVWIMRQTENMLSRSWRDNESRSLWGVLVPAPSSDIELKRTAWKICKDPKWMSFSRAMVCLNFRTVVDLIFSSLENTIWWLTSVTSCIYSWNPTFFSEKNRKFLCMFLQI